MIGYLTVNLEKISNRRPKKQKRLGAKNAYHKLLRLNPQLYAIVQPFTEQIHQVLLGSPPLVVKAYDAPIGIPIGKTYDDFYVCIDATPVTIEQIPEHSKAVFFPVWDFDVCQYVVAVEPNRKQCLQWLEKDQLQSVFVTEEKINVAILKAITRESTEEPGVVAAVAGTYYRVLPGKAVSPQLRKMFGDVHAKPPRIALLARSPVQMLQLAQEQEGTIETVAHAEALAQLALTGDWQQIVEQKPNVQHAIYPNVVTVGALETLANQLATEMGTFLYADPRLTAGTGAIAKLLHTGTHTGLMPVAEAVFTQPPENEEEYQIWEEYRMASSILNAYKYAVTTIRSTLSKKPPFQLFHLLAEAKPTFEGFFLTEDVEALESKPIREWMKYGGKLGTVAIAAQPKQGARQKIKLLLPFAPGLFLFSTLSQPRDTMTVEEKSLVPQALSAMERPTQRKQFTEQTMKFLNEYARLVDWTLGYRTKDDIYATISQNLFFMGGFDREWWEKSPADEKTKLTALQYVTGWPRSFYDTMFLAEIAGNMKVYGTDRPNDEQLRYLMALAPLLQFFRHEEAGKHLPQEWLQGINFQQHAWSSLARQISDKNPQEALQVVAGFLAKKLEEIGVEAVFAQLQKAKNQWMTVYFTPRSSLRVYEKEGKVFVSAKAEQDMPRPTVFLTRSVPEPQEKEERVIAYLDPRKVKPFPSTALAILSREQMLFPPSSGATFGIRYQVKQKPEAWQYPLESPFATQLPATIANLIAMFKYWDEIFEKIRK